MKFNRDRSSCSIPIASVRPLARAARGTKLKHTLNGADLKAWLDGEIAMEYTLGSEPVQAAGRPR